LKDNANGHFKAGDVQKAIEAYRDAVEHLLKMRRIG
jgi:pentatricopeptide repeat protein